MQPGGDSAANGTKPLSSGDAAYWPDWVNIGLPIVAVIVFIITVVWSLLHKSKHHKHIEVKLPVIQTKNDTHHSNASVISDNSDKKAEAEDKVSDMIQKAKEQARKSRAARRLSSIRSRVSSSSQYDYSPLDDATANQIEQDSSEDSDSDPVSDNVMTVNVQHHSPPRNQNNVLISSEDSGFNEARTSTSDNV